MRQMTLHLKISIYVAAGLVVIFTLLGLFGLYAVREGTRQGLDGRLVIARLAAFNVDAELDEQYTNLVKVSPALAPLIVRGGENLPPPDLDAEPFTLGMVIIDATGRVQWAEGRGVQLAGRLWGGSLIAGVLDGKGRATSDAFDLGSGQPCIALLVPVQAPGGRVVGVLAEAIDPTNDHFNQFIREASRLGATGHAELVDSHGRVITATEPGRNLLPGEHPDLYASVYKQGKAQIGTSAEYVDGGMASERHIMAVAPLKNGPWLLAIGGSEQEALAPARQWTILLFCAGALSLLAALVLVWITTQAITRPVRQLTASAQRLAAGDLDHPVATEAEAEVGQLAHSFDDMRQRLAGALNALTVEKRQYEAAFESMADALFTVDEQMRIATFNPAAERLTGLSAAAVRGRHCCDIFHPEGGGDHCDHCPMGNPGDSRMATVEHYLTPTGRRLTVASAISSIAGEDGRMVGVVHVMRDVSAQEKLHQLQDEFISTVSHELRTPLGFIKGYATTLLRRDTKVDQRTQRRFLRIIDQASDDLKVLIDNLLDMSKIGASALKLESGELDLGGLARRVVTKTRRGARDRRFSLKLPRTLPPVVGDPRRLEQVLGNLLENAVKYSPPNSRIAVTVQVEGGFASVCVADEGMGIPPEDLETIFERFYRSTRATGRGIGGTGLGLAICRGIVDAHGGRIWAANRPEGGSIFTFTLPLATIREEAGA